MLTSLPQLFNGHSMLPKSAGNNDFHQLQEREPNLRVARSDTIGKQRLNSPLFVAAKPIPDRGVIRASMGRCFSDTEE